MRRERLGTLRLLEMLGDWSSSDGPLHRQLSAVLRSCIDNGDLRPGTRFPSERSLAAALAVSRTTVVAAFSSLKQDGYVDSAPGSGTWVRPVRGFSPAGGISTPSATVGRNPLFARLGTPADDTIDLTAAVQAPSPLVAAVIEDAAAKLGGALSGTGYHPAGFPPLRAAVADWFSRRGLPTHENQVLVTAGGQQGIMLLAAAYIQPGDPVVAESPTYPGALDAFRLVGAVVRTVPVHPGGEVGEDVAAAVEAANPRLTYLIPTHHNPTGTVMGELGRRRLTRYLSERATVVVEDESLVELSLTGALPPRSLASHDDRVVTIGSASKPYWGGLRIGWIRGPDELIRRLGHYKTVFDMATPTITQAIACHLLDRSEEIVADRVRRLRGQQIALSQVMTSLLPDWKWIEPTGGLSIWARMPAGSATELTQVAQRQGLALVPGPFFDPHGRYDQHLRIPFVMPPAYLDRAVARLADIWHRYLGQSPVGRSDTA